MTTPEKADRVIDPLDGSIREVDHIKGTTVHMVDGGVMGVGEITRVFLPGEKVERTAVEQGLWSETQSHIEDWGK